jgi:hypothetical protein
MKVLIVTAFLFITVQIHAGINYRVGDEVLAQCGMGLYSGKIEKIGPQDIALNYRDPAPNEICSRRLWGQLAPLNLVRKIEITTGNLFWKKTQVYEVGQTIRLTLGGKKINGEIVRLTAEGLAQVHFADNLTSDLSATFLPLTIMAH